MSSCKELKVTCIPEHLKLLSDFVFDVPVVRVLLAQSGFKIIYLAKSKFLAAQPFDISHNIQQPAAGF